MDTIKKFYQENYQQNVSRLNHQDLSTFVTKIMGLLFPQWTSQVYSWEDYQQEWFELKTCFHRQLSLIQSGEQFQTEAFFQNFTKELLSIQKILLLDAHYIFEEDPAAKKLEEVILTYPGFYAIAIYRIAHYLYNQNLPLLPRALSELAHRQTGIDIHPAAQISYPFFIDHGTGIVIGETAIIGKRVKLFQGVTLGAKSVKKADQEKKRHPTLMDNCLVYANATILGGDTIIPANFVIGGNSWITESPKNN